MNLKFPASFLWLFFYDWISCKLVYILIIYSEIQLSHKGSPVLRNLEIYFSVKSFICETCRKKRKSVLPVLKVLKGSNSNTGSKLGTQHHLGGHLEAMSEARQPRKLSRGGMSPPKWDVTPGGQFCVFRSHQYSTGMVTTEITLNIRYKRSSTGIWEKIRDNQYWDFKVKRHSNYRKARSF